MLAYSSDMGIIVKNAWQEKSFVFLSPRICKFYYKEDNPLCNGEKVDIKMLLHNLLENIRR